MADVTVAATAHMHALAHTHAPIHTLKLSLINLAFWFNKTAAVNSSRRG